MEDLESRHVIPKSYFDDPNKAYKDRQKSRKETRRTLKRRLHKERRPSVKDLEAQNIVPRDYFATDNDGLVTYFEDPQRAKEQRKRTKKAKKRALKHRLDKMRSPSRTDLENKHIVPSSGYFDDPQTASDKRRKSLEDKKERIRAHHKARPSIADLKAENIMPEDHEVIAELKNIAQKHQRMESAVKDLSNRLPFEAETNDQVAKTMMQHINDTEADIHLTGSTLSDEEDGDSDVSSEEEYGDGTRGSEQVFYFCFVFVVTTERIIIFVFLLFFRRNHRGILILIMMLHRTLSKLHRMGSRHLIWKHIRNRIINVV